MRSIVIYFLIKLCQNLPIKSNLKLVSLFIKYCIFAAAFAQEDLGRIHRRSFIHNYIWLGCKYCLLLIIHKYCNIVFSYIILTNPILQVLLRLLCVRGFSFCWFFPIYQQWSRGIRVRGYFPKTIPEFIINNYHHPSSPYFHWKRPRASTNNSKCKGYIHPSHRYHPITVFAPYRSLVS